MKLLHPPWQVQVAAIVTCIALLPTIVFSVFYYQEMRPQWQNAAFAPYQQGADAIAADFADALEEMMLKSQFLANSSVVRNAVLEVDRYLLEDSLDFMYNLSQLVDAVTAETPQLCLKLYPDRCNYSIGSHCLSTQQLYIAFQDEPALLEKIWALPNQGVVQTVRTDPTTGNAVLSFYSRIRLFDGIGAVLESSVPLSNIFNVPATLPKDATVYLSVSDDSYFLLYESQKGIPPDRIVIQSSVKGAEDITIWCIFPEEIITEYSASEAWPVFLLLSALIVGVLITSLSTSKIFYKRVNRLISTVGEKVDGVLHGAPAEITETSDLKQLESKIYKLVEQARYYYESNIRYAQTQQQIELELLQMRFNPHFLYNTLNTIRFQSKNMEIRRVIDSLVHYYRIVLSNGNLIIQLQEEMAMIEEYLRLERYAYTMNNVSWEICMDEAVRNCAVIKHILQPIVENALFHGIRTKPEGGCITIYARAVDSDVMITVSDTGNGMSNEQIAALLERSRQGKSGSYGVKNVQQRIQVFYGAKYGLDIRSEMGSGTCVTIRIPMRPFSEDETERNDPDVSSNDS